MDVLSDQLARARARGAVFSTLRRVAPWGLEFSGLRPLTAHILLEGAAWLSADGEEPVRLDTGDVVLATRGEPYRIVSEIGADAETITAARRRGSDRGPGRAATVLCGAYVVEGSVGRNLLESLPRFVRIPPAGQTARHREAIALLAAEAGEDETGQQALLDRLLDLNLVYALRSWWQQDRTHAPGWYRALAHEGLARVMQEVHQRPAHKWTLEAMAHTAAMSRAAFTATFKKVTGQSPGAYVTQLRMGHAEDLLLRTDAPLAAVAARVGYTNEFAFATAFRRAHGLAPGQWRTAQHQADARQDSGSW